MSTAILGAELEQIFESAAIQDPAARKEHFRRISASLEQQGRLDSVVRYLARRSADNESRQPNHGKPQALPSRQSEKGQPACQIEPADDGSHDLPLAAQWRAAKNDTPRRLAIYRYLVEQGLPSGEIISILGISRSNLCRFRAKAREVYEASSEDITTEAVIGKYVADHEASIRRLHALREEAIANGQTGLAFVIEATINSASRKHVALLHRLGALRDLTLARLERKDPGPLSNMYDKVETTGWGEYRRPRRPLAHASSKD